MKRKFNLLLKKLWMHVVGNNLSLSMIKMLAKLGEVNLLLLAYDQIGILKYQNSCVSGEKYVIETILKQLFGKSSLVIFDVGANLGSYSKELREAIPDAAIYAFEPNPNTFALLKANLKHSQDHCFCVGFSDVVESRALYTYESSLTSAHASIHKNVFTDIHKASAVSGLPIELTTIDQFCFEHNLAALDFLKIDTEGNELNVLKGAKRMLKEHRIAVIQFEFNEMDVISRVFVKDFFDLLPQYDIYRLDTHRLIPLAEYDSFYEIYKFQNLLAISKDLNRKK